MITRLKILFRSVALWFLIQSKGEVENIIVCQRCYVVLQNPINPVATQRLICLKCLYLAQGGTFPKFPTIKNLAIYQAITIKKVPVYDQVWTSLTIEKGLEENGRIALAAQWDKRPLTAEEFAKLGMVREVARSMGYKQESINAIEMSVWPCKNLYGVAA